MIYYIWMSYLISQFESWDQRIIYFVFNNILTSIVFVEIILAHVAMPTDPFTDQEEFALHQIRTSLDIKCSPWFDWFYGGLNYQVVHHIWPRMARPHYRRAGEMLRKFCKEHDVPYVYITITECLTRVLRHVKDIATNLDEYYEEMNPESKKLD